MGRARGGPVPSLPLSESHRPLLLFPRPLIQNPEHGPGKVSPLLAVDAVELVQQRVDCPSKPVLWPVLRLPEEFAFSNHSPKSTPIQGVDGAGRG